MLWESLIINTSNAKIHIKSLENVLLCIMGFEPILDSLEKEKRKSNYNEHKYGWMINDGIIVVNPEEHEKIKTIRQDYSEMIKIYKEHKMTKFGMTSKAESYE